MMKRHLKPDRKREEGTKTKVKKLGAHIDTEGAATPE